MGSKLVIGAVALLAAYVLLPSLGVAVGVVLNEATAVLLMWAPKVAVVAGVAALILLCIPFTRHHAQGMLAAAILLALGAAGMSAGVAWIEGHSAVVTADVLSAGNTLLARLTPQGGVR